MKTIFAALMMLAMAACTTPDTLPQSVYFVEGTYAAALRAELLYSSYPRCTAGQEWSVAKPCSKLAVIKAMQRADDAAWVAIKNAQEAARTPGIAESKVTLALASAKALTGAFKGITDIYKIE